MSVSQFQRDERKDAEGIWVGKDIFDPNPDGTFPEFKIRPAYRSNAEWKQAQVEWRRKNPRVFRSRGVDYQSESEKMAKYAFIKACLKDWRNFYDKHGKPIPFNKDNVQDRMTRLPMLYDSLVEAAGDDNQFMEDVDDIKGE